MALNTIDRLITAISLVRRGGAFVVDVINASAGAPDANKIPMTGTGGKIDATLLDPVGLLIAMGLAEVVVASAVIATAPCLVQVANGGVATPGGVVPCNGFVLDNAGIGDPVTVFYHGVVELEDEGGFIVAGGNAYQGLGSGLREIGGSKGVPYRLVGTALEDSSHTTSGRVKILFHLGEWV